MGRFFCFSASPQRHKSKKNVPQPARPMQAAPNISAEGRLMERRSKSSSLNIRTDEFDVATVNMQNAVSSSHEDCWRSEDLNACSCPDDSRVSPQAMYIKKSVSLGNMLGLNDLNCNRIAGPNHRVIHAGTEENICNDSNMHNSHDSSNGAADHFGEKHSGSSATYDHVDPSAQHYSQQVLRSKYADLQADDADDPNDSITAEKFERHFRSYDDLLNIGGNNVDCLTSEVNYDCTPCSHGDDRYMRSGMKAIHDVIDETDGVRSTASAAYEDLEDILSNDEYWKGKSVLGDQSIDSACYDDFRDECHHSGITYGVNEMPDFDISHENADCTTCQQPISISDFSDVVTKNAMKETGTVEDEYEERPPVDAYHQCNEIAYEEVHINRIKKWIDQIEIGSELTVDEFGECSNAKCEDDSEPVASVHPESRSSRSIDMAYNYISTLSPLSLQAQLVNLGLVAIPVLSAFSGLRLLNLSSNHIVKINAGALPKGLHALSLAGNNISTIEGLKDLARLRILDLSYNRISRIGHGLSYCSSLRELYIASNKISHIEGLHRLMKLKILDLRKNKISAAKGLGQLAANYSSLEMINLEGNPALKNVGHDQLKKFLLTLLPNLAYYNNHAMRPSGSRGVSDRHARSALSHHSDRSARSERKSSRRLAKGTAAHKVPHQAFATRASSILLKPPLKMINDPSSGPSSKPVQASCVAVESSNPLRRVKSEGKL